MNTLHRTGVRLLVILMLALVCVPPSFADDAANWKQLQDGFHWALTTGKMPKGAELRIKVVEVTGRAYLDVGTPVSSAHA